jgi:uncharacterized membrane protein YdbT with pleckstrin-like domain
VPFPRRLINEGEDVVLDLHPHWWFFARPVGVGLVLAITAAFAARIQGDARQAVLIAIGLASALWLVWLLVRILVWRTTHFVVTSDRLIFRSGVLSKQGREIPLERINDISFNQTFWERILGAGDLLIESAGERGQNNFSDIAKPEHVQLLMYRQIEANTRKTAGYSRDEPTIPEQIEQLAELRDGGLISPEEFEQKKAELLDRM